MPRNLLISLILTAVAISVGPSAGGAQNAVPAPQTPRPYNPGMGDLMNGIVQPRHAKLGLAGREQNWELAAYALHELKQALQNVALTRPALARVFSAGNDRRRRQGTDRSYRPSHKGR
jgi:hypothetical protein